LTVGIWGNVEALFAFVAVLLLALLAARLAALRTRLPGRYLKVLDVLHLGPSRQVVLLSIGTRLVLIGMSDKSIARILTIDRSELGDGSLEDGGGATPGPGGRPGFLRVLSEIMGKGRHPGTKI
jgi:flagellar biogenesis protein FliO